MKTNVQGKGNTLATFDLKLHILETTNWTSGGRSIEESPPGGEVKSLYFTTR